MAALPITVALHNLHLNAVLFALALIMLCCPTLQVTLPRHQEVAVDAGPTGGVRSHGHSVTTPGDGAPIEKTSSTTHERFHHPLHSDRGLTSSGRHRSHTTGDNEIPRTASVDDHPLTAGTVVEHRYEGPIIVSVDQERKTRDGDGAVLSATGSANGQQRGEGGVRKPSEGIGENMRRGEETTRTEEQGGDSTHRSESTGTAGERRTDSGSPTVEGVAMVTASSASSTRERLGGEETQREQSQREQMSEEQFQETSGSSGSEDGNGIGNLDDRQKKTQCEKCHKAQQEDLLDAYDPQALVQLRIESIKRMILDKLRMERPPQVNVSRINIPAPLSEGMFIDEVDDDDREQSHVKHLMPGEEYDADEDYYGKTTRVIVPAKDELPPCSDTLLSSSCFEFNISSVVRSKVTMAELWLYWNGEEPTTRNHTLILTQQKRHGERTSRHIATHTVPASQTAGWVSIDIKHTVRRWRSHSYHDQVVKVECPTCESNSIMPFAVQSRFRPFIVIRVTDEQRTRKRRNVNCDENTTGCCRQHFRLRFVDIGWDWIISPRGFDANYCRGSCQDFNSPSLTHTSIIQTYRSSTPGVNIPRPCCSPRTSGPVSMIYMDDQDKFLTADLPNMSILSCGCS